MSILDSAAQSVKDGINGFISEKIETIKNAIHDFIVDGNSFDNFCLIVFMSCLTMNIMNVPYTKRLAGITLAIYIMIKFLVVSFL